MNNTLENINEIMIVKKELKNILTAIGVEPDDKFDNYAYLFSYALSLINDKTNDINGE